MAVSGKDNASRGSGRSSGLDHKRDGGKGFRPRGKGAQSGEKGGRKGGRGEGRSEGRGEGRGGYGKGNRSGRFEKGEGRRDGGSRESWKERRGDSPKKGKGYGGDRGKGKPKGFDGRGKREFAGDSRSGDRKRDGGFRKDGRRQYFEVKPVTEERTPIEGLEQAASEEEGHPKKWEPNRKPRKVKSKKDFDRERMQSLVDGTETIYRGELDPREKDPDRKPRSISRSEQLVMRKAEALAEADAAENKGRNKLASHTDFRDLYERNDASPGRLAALYATQQVRMRNAYAQEVIEASIDTATIPDVDRSFATLLTLGVVSTQGALDEVLNRCMASPRDIQPDVRDAMRISTYEIIYLRKAPHAALDQGVELVRAIAPSASGLANAVLHRVLECSDAFPFGDPSKDIDALALLYAFPTWLAKRLVADMGAQDAAQLMKASNDPAPLFISVNSLQASDEEVLSLFEEVGAEVEAAEAGAVSPMGCYRISKSRALADGRIRRLFSQGKILVSDAAAQAVAQCVLEDGKPSTLLEVGAGRGTKTLLLQNMSNRMYGDQLTLTSMDSHGFKTDLLRERAQDYGVQINDLIVGNGARLDSVMGDRMFERIFIDAPCSGLGTLRRHQEIRWRLNENQINDLADVGLSLLKSAAGHVEPGGSIVYSTCTVTYDENNGVVKRFLECAEGAEFKLAPIYGNSCFTSKLVSGGPDAHFAAKFVRNKA